MLIDFIYLLSCIHLCMYLCIICIMSVYVIYIYIYIYIIYIYIYNIYIQFHFTVFIHFYSASHGMSLSEALPTTALPNQKRITSNRYTLSKSEVSRWKPQRQLVAML